MAILEYLIGIFHVKDFKNRELTMSNSSKQSLMAISALLIGIVSNTVMATPITVTNPFNYVDNVSNNSAGIATGVREVFGAHDVIPNGDNGTTGTASRGAATLDLNFFPFDVAPDFFCARYSAAWLCRGYQAGTGASTASDFLNGIDTAQVVTPNIVGASVVPFANSVTMHRKWCSANASTGPYLSTFAPDEGPNRIRDTTEFVGTGGVGGSGMCQCHLHENVLRGHDKLLGERE